MAEFAISVIFVCLLFSFSSLTTVHGDQRKKEVESEGKINNNKCDLFDGIWVYDESYPLYESSDCDFIEKQFDCSKNGRPDKFYLKYSWHPSACKLPRFNGEAFLERMRGKSIMFVGDSLSVNQWQSLTCMLHKSVSHSQYTNLRNGLLSTFTFPEYDVKVMMSRNVFLVDLVDEESVGRVLKLDSIEAGQFWKQFNVLIFDSWHWWLHAGRRQPWDYIQEGNQTVRDMDRLVAYEKALRTWAKWVDNNVDPSKTTVFFQAVSPDHMHGKDWGEEGSNTCEGQERPVKGKSYGGGPHPAELVVEKVLREMSNPNLVYLLNITTLSQLRKDGHPSVYGYGGHRGIDCTHWCLPGVPDTWNQLLYAALITQN
ncbi:hypothetical protein QN277_018584 [Acacia crassicarpa]|uniref:Trichome birefringence-like N-terminal domain-containing protein n=1 Tax=Acacia crassicarpa TaxID=499986 RepID=A0AAE1MUP7_9FABA|nr:hypothetical protein QN277_018584 [Acacia crassicarpa]